MKKTLFLLLAITLVLGACKPKITEVENNVAPEDIENTETENPYISETQAEDTPAPEEDLSGEVISLTASEFTERITPIYDEKGFQYKGHTPCLVDFYADWCRPCMELKPILAEVAKEYKGKIIIYKVNVDKARDICDVFDITSIPTLMYFRPEQQPLKMVGAPSKAELKASIEDFLSR